MASSGVTSEPVSVGRTFAWSSKVQYVFSEQKRVDLQKVIFDMVLVCDSDYNEWYIEGGTRFEIYICGRVTCGRGGSFI